LKYTRDLETIYNIAITKWADGLRSNQEICKSYFLLP